MCLLAHHKTLTLFAHIENRNSFFHFENGNGELDSGTSGAVPTIASVITLVNDARLAAGKKPVGMSPSLSLTLHQFRQLLNFMLTCFQPGFINPTVSKPRYVHMLQFMSCRRSILLDLRMHSTM